MSSLEYYNDPTKWGQHQYVTLREVINNFIMSRDADDYNSNTPRFKLLYQAKRGFRELYYDVVREVKAIELELSPALNVILPPDYINYVRISWVDEHGQLHPMAVDNKMSIAQEYLQDSDYNLLFDSNGCVLKGDTDDVPLDTNPDGLGQGLEPFNRYTFCQGIPFQPNLDTSRVFENGRYRVDNSRGVIQFGSDAFGKHIVLEYISDGLYTGCEGRSEEELRIHKFAEAALLDYIYYESIKNRRNVPYNEKQRARKEYFNNRKIAKQRMNAMRTAELLQAFRASSKWIK